MADKDGVNDDEWRNKEVVELDRRVEPAKHQQIAGNDADGELMIFLASEDLFHRLQNGGVVPFRPILLNEELGSGEAVKNRFLRVVRFQPRDDFLQFSAFGVAKFVHDLLHEIPHARGEPGQRLCSDGGGGGGGGCGGCGMSGND